MFHLVSGALLLAFYTRCSYAGSNFALLSPVLRTSDAKVSGPLDPSFPGFGIESSNLFSYTGGEDPNKFSIQLLQNLADFAGKPPHIRVGGNTQDYMIYDEEHIDFYWKFTDDAASHGPDFAADSMIFGPSFFTALERFPKGTPITYGLNMGYRKENWTETIVRSAAAALNRLKNTRLYSFEIGNEPDLYDRNGMRDARDWNGYRYTDEFLQRAEAVYLNVLKPAGLPSTFFESAATASTMGNTFEVKELVNAGLIEPYNGHNYISSWNQHDYFWFVGVSSFDLTIDSLLDMDKTNDQFTYWRKQVGIALGTGLPYALREMSNAGPLGLQDISDTFAAAIWTLNFFLYAATLDISSVGMHMTDNSYASAWQPITIDGKQPYVRPSYYAHVAMAQIIGNGNGTTQIGDIPVKDVGKDYKGRIRAYAAYAQDHLQAVVLINAKPAFKADAPAPGFIFKLNLGEENGNKNIYISYLTAPGAESQRDTKFNGMVFSSTTGETIIDDKNAYILRTSPAGIASISVRDTEAVVVNIGSLLGRNAVTTKTEGFTPKKQSAASSQTSGSRTAAWTGVVTTTLAIASSATGKSEGGSNGKRKEWHGNGALKSLCVCLCAVGFGFFYVA